MERERRKRERDKRRRNVFRGDGDWDVWDVGGVGEVGCEVWSNASISGGWVVVLPLSETCKLSFEECRTSLLSEEKEVPEWSIMGDRGDERGGRGTDEF